MRKLYEYLRKFWDDEWNWMYFGCILLFLGVCIGLNYSLDFEARILKSYKKSSYYFFLVFLYYALPYYYASFTYAICYKKYAFLKSVTFWSTSAIGLALLSFSESFIGHRTLLETHFVEGPTLWFLKSCTNYVVSFVILFFGIACFWFYKDRKKAPLYGFSTQKFQAKPYLTMILIMLPLISWASFQPDFLVDYPTYKGYGANKEWQISEVWQVIVYELVYGLDFVTVELFFRGFLILALAETMGTAVIIPMATLYCVFHFGKPMAETISSFIGGSILGIFAYYSRSIYGGIIIHLSVAFLMELAAYFQKM